MFSFTFIWLIAAAFTLRLFQFYGTAEEFLAFVALVSLSLIILASGAGPINVSIGKEEVTFFAITLFHFVLKDPAIFLSHIEDFLHNGGMPRCTGSAKVVKIYVKPLVNIFVYLKVVITNLFR
jgi:hypothetical protein